MKRPAWQQPSDSLDGITTWRPAAPRAEIAMRTLAQNAFLESEIGTVSELPSAGTPLENPYVYDASAKELKAMALQGLLKVVEERRSDLREGALIRRLVFKRLR